MSRKYPLVESRLEKMKNLYLQGNTVEEICDILGYKTAKHVEYRLSQMGVYETQCDIDVPKVLALQKAGWNMPAIINEFGYTFTAKQIIDAVNRYGRRKQKERIEDVK